MYACVAGICLTCLRPRVSERPPVYNVAEAVRLVNPNALRSLVFKYFHCDQITSREIKIADWVLSAFHVNSPCVLAYLLCARSAHNGRIKDYLKWNKKPMKKNAEKKNARPKTRKFFKPKNFTKKAASISEQPEAKDQGFGVGGPPRPCVAFG